MEGIVWDRVNPPADRAYMEEDWGADRDQSSPSKAHAGQFGKGLGTGFCKRKNLLLHCTEVGNNDAESPVSANDAPYRNLAKHGYRRMIDWRK